MNHRLPHTIIYDMLRVLDVKPKCFTTIMTRANLSHKNAESYMRILRDNGCVIVSIDAHHKNHWYKVYTITEKGMIDRAAYAKAVNSIPEYFGVGKRGVIVVENNTIQ